MYENITITERLKIPGQFLIREYASFSPSVERKDNNNLILKGVMQRAESKNGNGRIYNRRILEREINKYQEKIKLGRALGECDHSSEAEVLLKNTSHVIEKIWWEGNEVIGEMKILNTPCGKILQALVEAGISLGISTRGVGSVTEGNDGSFVNDDYQLICFDAVADPSTQGAYMLREGKLIKVGQNNSQLLTNENINELSKKDLRIKNIINDILRG